MDIVLRSVNQRFLEEVVFPTFELGAKDSQRALERLAGAIGDPLTRMQVEALIERGSDGGWSEVDLDRFQEVVYRLLFSEWRRTGEGWIPDTQDEAYAGDLEETLHLALMITDPSYPYWDEAEARRQRGQAIAPPYLDRGLPAFIGGVWEPFPAFAPGEVLTTRGTNIYVPSERLAVADWSWRHPVTVQEWSDDLPRALRDLMNREVQRLRPIEVPEANEVIDYWTGKVSEPPQLVVGFSGLGPRSGAWVREIADLAAQIRRAAAREQGLTAIITGGTRSWF
ncbi:MAG: hypothetical protein IRZ16_03930 [Myxococcaceae bacterium]|nr:hypothetical protein [Myxococcaceae bacterium]